MKPSALKPGMRVRRADSSSAPVLTFVRRDALHRACVLQAEAYRGQNGPDDAGFVQVSDYDMSRKYQRAAAQGAAA